MKERYRRSMKRKVYLIFLCLLVSGCSQPVNKDHNSVYEGTAADEKNEHTSINTKADYLVNSVIGAITDIVSKVLQIPADPQLHSDKNQTNQSMKPEDLSEPANLTISHNVSSLDGMEDRRHLFVKYQDRVYYRQYHEDSFEEGGVFKRYQPVKGSKKEMMCVYPDGRIEAVFTDTGNGGFWILNDRIYMTEMDNYPSDVYSVDMQGGNRVGYGNGFIRGADEEKNLLFLELLETEGQNGYKFYVMDCENNELTLLWEEEEYIKSFLTYDEGRIYYESREDRAVDDTITREYTIKLMSVLPDGSGEICLATVQMVKSYYQSIQQVQIVDGTIYFSYGGYQGSASVYQGGSIASVNTDGTDFRVIIDSEESFASEYFYVQDMEDRVLIHYNSMFEMQGEDMVARDTKTGGEVQSNLPYQSKGQPYHIFWCNWTDGIWESGSIYTIAGHSGTVVELTDLINEKILWNEEYSPDFLDMTYIDGWLYFTVQFSEFDDSYRIGWRDGYKRLRTDVYRLDIENEIMEHLYFY